MADEDKLTRSICQDSFFEFFKEFWDVMNPSIPLDLNWHIEYICNELQELAERVIAGEDKKYDEVINISPGTTKSSIISTAFQPWVWGKMPHARFICGSHTETLVLDLSRKARDIVESDKYKRLFPEIVLRDDQNTKGYWANTKGGDRFSATVGGKTPMGMHAHFIIIDDPIDPQKALSAAELKRANDWIDGTLPSRKVSKTVTVTILVMQRLDQDDPSARMIEKGDVRHICLPADTDYKIKPAYLKKYYVKVKTPDGKEIGLMDPRRLSIKALSEAKKGGEYYYAGQYGQDPAPPKGGMFKYGRILLDVAPPITVRHKWKRLCRYWDKAACLITGTQVETLLGSKPIESVEEGDLVLTRDGYKEVEWSGMSGRVWNLTTVLFSSGEIITGTDDHPVWTENRYWVDLAMLGEGDYNVGIPTNQEVLACPGKETQILRKLSSMGYAIPGSRDSVILKRGGGTKTLENMKRTPCTGLSGDITTVPFPLAIISTTLTKTTTTIRLKILNASLEANTCLNIERNSGRRLIENFCVRYAHWLKKELLENGPKGSTEIISVSGAEISSKVGALIKNPRSIARLDVGIEQGIAVYDLQVSEAHEFFANGVLVHNTAGGGAFTVGLLLGWDKEGHFWVLDVIRDQWNTGDREKAITQTAEVDGPAVYVGIEEEPGSGGKESAESTMKRLIAMGRRVKVNKPSGSESSKVIRADDVSSAVNQGLFKMVKAKWNKIFLDELKYFPRSKYKDQVDALSGAYTVLTKSIASCAAL